MRAKARFGECGEEGRAAGSVGNETPGGRPGRGFGFAIQLDPGAHENLIGLDAVSAALCLDMDTSIAAVWRRLNGR